MLGLKNNNAAHLEPETEESDSDKVIIDDVFNVSSEETQIVLTKSGVKLISLKDRKNEKKDGKIGQFIDWRDIINASNETLSTESSQPWVLNYIHHGSKSNLHHRCLKVRDKNGTSDKFITSIIEQFSKVVGRPKKLFVLINPIGGSGKGRRIYEKVADPLFKLAAVETHVFVTEKSKHALEIGESQDFSQYDGIVIVGGDGLYQEFLQGLTIQTQKKAGINYDDPNVEFTKLNIPIGIIPAGTGNGLTYLVNGITHVKTAVLNIIRGEQHRAQVFIVHSGSKFLCVSAETFGYGVFSDLMKRTEELRWMKKARYAYALVALLLKKKRLFQAELHYCLKLEDDSSDGKEPGEHKKSDWIIHENETKNYSCIYSVPCELVDAGDHNIVDPFGSHVMLCAGTGCGHVPLFKTISYTMFGKKINSTLSNIDLIDRVTDFKIKILRNEQDGARASEIELEHLVTIDGEVIPLESLDITVGVKPSFTLLYGMKKTLNREIEGI